MIFCFDFLNVLVLSNIACFFAHLKACANRPVKVLMSVYKANKGESEKERERTGTCNKS
jgi:hypothetical protein